MQLKNSIPEILKSHRSNSKLTQRQVAEAAGLNTKTYSSYEEGRAEPDIKTIISIAAVYGHDSIDRFLNIIPDKSNLAKVQDAYLRLPADKRKIVDFILAK